MKSFRFRTGAFVSKNRSAANRQANRCHRKLRFGVAPVMVLATHVNPTKRHGSRRRSRVTFASKNKKKRRKEGGRHHCPRAASPSQAAPANQPASPPSKMIKKRPKIIKSIFFVRFWDFFWPANHPAGPNRLKNEPKSKKNTCFESFWADLALLCLRLAPLFCGWPLFFAVGPSFLRFWPFFFAVGPSFLRLALLFCGSGPSFLRLALLFCGWRAPLRP